MQQAAQPPWVISGTDQPFFDQFRPPAESIPLQSQAAALASPPFVLNPDRSQAFGQHGAQLSTSQAHFGIAAAARTDPRMATAAPQCPFQRGAAQVNFQAPREAIRRGSASSEPQSVSQQDHVEVDRPASNDLLRYRQFSSFRPLAPAPQRQPYFAPKDPSTLNSTELPQPSCGWLNGTVARQPQATLTHTAPAHRRAPSPTFGLLPPDGIQQPRKSPTQQSGLVEGNTTHTTSAQHHTPPPVEELPGRQITSTKGTRMTPSIQPGVVETGRVNHFTHPRVPWPHAPSSSP